MTATITVTGDAMEAARADAARTAAGPQGDAIFGDLFEDHHAGEHVDHDEPS